MSSPKVYYDEDKDTKFLFDCVFTTLTFLSEAYPYCHSYAFLKISKEDEDHIKNEIFNFHATTANFFLVVQFCKLFEKGSKGNGQASLLYLNKILHDKHITKYKDYDRIKQTLEEIQRDKLFNKLLLLRNKSYAHSGKHRLNAPLRSLRLDNDELIAFKDLLIKTISAFKLIHEFL